MGLPQDCLQCGSHGNVHTLRFASQAAGQLLRTQCASSTQHMSLVSRVTSDGSKAEMRTDPRPSGSQRGHWKASGPCVGEDGRQAAALTSPRLGLYPGGLEHRAADCVEASLTPT